MSVTEDAKAEWQRGDWMQTNSGGRFYPRDPQVKDIHPEDIAHALSLLCRYAGHVDRFYSVAEHCVLLSYAVAPEHALAALLHDATEAYLVDVPRPLKRMLPEYMAIEDHLWSVIATRFGISDVLPDEVKEADTRILLTERAELMERAEVWGADNEFTPLPVTVRGLMPEAAERLYLGRLDALVSKTPKCLSCGTQIFDPTAGSCHECGAEDRFVGSQWAKPGFDPNVMPFDVTRASDSLLVGKPREVSLDKYPDHVLRFPPHDDGSFIASALCSCRRYRWDSSESPLDLVRDFETITADWRTHVINATAKANV